jgi:tetratricopeptide (TPR) repeat protein
LLNLKKSNQEVFTEFLILILTLLVYCRVWQFEFTTWDDGDYILINPYLNKWDWANFSEMMQVFWMGNYHPLSMLSLSIDATIFGGWAGGYHLTNLFFHLMNTWLLIRILKFWFKDSILVYLPAVLFGIHPMHVESVAWVSERKDVLYTFFYFLAVIQYNKYSTKFDKKYLWFTGIFFVLSLLSKAMAVSLVPTLVLIDYLKGRNLKEKKVWLEKLPFFVVAVFFGIVAIKAQEVSNALVTKTSIFWIERPFLAAFAFYKYLEYLIAPVNLLAFYGYPVNESTGRLISNVIYLFLLIPIGVLFIIYKYYRENKIIWFGWLFFVINIAQVLQLLPVGGALISDRYTYIAAIGLFIVFAHLVKWLIVKWNGFRYGVVFLCFIYAYAGYTRTFVWKDGITLWTDQLNKSPGSTLALNNRGTAYSFKGKYDLALIDFHEVELLTPNDPMLLNNIGNVLGTLKDFNKAKAYFEKALRNDSVYANAWYGLGNSFSGLGDYTTAASCYRKAYFLKPRLAAISAGFGNNFLRQSQPDSALVYFNKAVYENPLVPTFYNDRALAFLNLGDTTNGMNDLARSLELDSLSNSDVWFNLGVVYKTQGKTDLAAFAFGKALNINSKDYQARKELSLVYYRQGKVKESIAELKEAVISNPDYFEGWNNLGYLLNEQKEYMAAKEALLKACLLDAKYPLAWNNLGLVYINLGMKDSAAFALKKSAALYPENPALKENTNRFIEKFGESIR